MNSTSSTSSSAVNLAIIDFQRWTRSASRSERLAVAKDLVLACHETGFAYITNHGISTDSLDEIFSMAKSFYNLPHEKKMQAGHPEGSMAFRGYSWPGHENVDTGGEIGDGVDFTESYGVGSDSFKEEPNVWLSESTLPNFRAVTTRFYWECWTISQEILRALALGLGFDDEEFLLRFHSGHENELNLRHYPPVSESIFQDRRMKRLSEHTDFDSFTLLFQDDCGGLEVQKLGQQGDFMHADPLEGALIMNIGDVLMRWSNDYLKSTIHRVQLPPLQDRFTGEERMTRERFSIPYFVCVERDTLMECLPVCHSTKNPPKYEPMLYRDYVNWRMSEVFSTSEQ